MNASGKLRGLVSIGLYALVACLLLIVALSIVQPNVTTIEAANCWSGQGANPAHLPSCTNPSFSTARRSSSSKSSCKDGDRDCGHSSSSTEPCPDRDHDCGTPTPRPSSSSSSSKSSSSASSAASNSSSSSAMSSASSSSSTNSGGKSSSSSSSASTIPPFVATPTVVPKAAPHVAPVAGADPPSEDSCPVVYEFNADGKWQVGISREDGSHRRVLTDFSSDNRDPVLSPNCQFIAFRSNRDGNWQIYVMYKDGGNQRRFTHTSYDNFAPLWSRDNLTIFFRSLHDGSWQNDAINADGTDLRTLP